MARGDARDGIERVPDAGGVSQGVAVADREPAVELRGDERPAGDGGHRLREGVRRLSDPRPSTRGRDDYLHWVGVLGVGGLLLSK